MNDDQRYQAPALEKGLEILEFLASAGAPFALSELGRALGRSRNEIYRIVIVLERLAYLHRTSDDRLEVTTKLFDVAMQAPPQHDLLAEALPAMRRLAEQTYQSCHLVVTSGTDIVVVARTESPDRLGFSLRIGFRRPIHLAASGWLLHAYQPADVQAAWEAAAGADPESWRAMRSEAQAIRATGLHIAPSFYIDAVTDIGAPVFAGRDRTVIAALTIPYLSGRSARLGLTQTAAILKEETARISAAL